MNRIKKAQHIAREFVAALHESNSDFAHGLRFVMRAALIVGFIIGVAAGAAACYLT